MRKIIETIGKSKIGVFLSISLLVFFCSACTSPNQFSRNNNANQDELSGTIVLLDAYPEEYFSPALIAEYQSTLKQYIKKFTKLYPKVQIILESVDEDDLLTTIINKAKKGLSPDLIFAQPNNTLPLIKAKAIQPLDRFDIDLIQFRPESIVQVLYQGKIYGLPFNINTQVLCYNKDKVLEVPKTLSDLIIQARKGYSVGMVSRFEDAFS